MFQLYNISSRNLISTINKTQFTEIIFEQFSSNENLVLFEIVIGDKIGILIRNLMTGESERILGAESEFSEFHFTHFAFNGKKLVSNYTQLHEIFQFSIFPNLSSSIISIDLTTLPRY